MEADVPLRDDPDVLSFTPSEWRDAPIDVEVQDRASKLAGDDTYAAQVATARAVYDALVAATSWKVVLIVDDETAAIRERITSAA